MQVFPLVNYHVYKTVWLPASLKVQKGQKIIQDFVVENIPLKVTIWCMHSWWVIYLGQIIKNILKYAGFPRLLETLEKPGIYFGSLNPGNSLEFCVKTLNSLEICERQNRSTQIFFFLSKLHSVLSSTIFYEHYWYLFRMLHRPKQILKLMGEVARNLIYV